METAIWIICGLAAGALGYLATGAVLRRWPSWQIPVLLAIVAVQLALIFFVDIEPPQETSTLRSGNIVLAPWLANLAWMARASLSGGYLAGVGVRFGSAVSK